MTIQTESLYSPLEERMIGSFAWTAEEAVAVDDDGILAATSLATTAMDITEFDAQPACTRLLTLKTTGTAGDVKAGKIKVFGTNINGEPISEEVSLTADTALNATTARAFKTVEKVACPAMDGSGVKLKIGWADKYGLPFISDKEVLMYSIENGAVATAATITADAELAKNVVAFHTASNGKSREIVVLC